MKLFSAAQIREIDRFTIENEPIPSIDLMERAAGAIFSWFAANICPLRKIVVFAGSGNNGGDGLALTRMLIETGFDVEVYYLEASSYSNDFQLNLKRLNKQGIVNPTCLSTQDQLPILNKNSVVVDALFGSGLSRPLGGFAALLIDYLNKCDSQIISIDIPSGLFCDENPFPNSNPVVKASLTLTLQFPKLSFFNAENYAFVNDWIVLPIGLHNDAINLTRTPFTLVEKSMVASMLNHRKKFDHKGEYGHCMIIAGSYGMMGAAVLSSTACIKTGSGLVTAHIPKTGYAILQQSVPEVMVDIDNHDLSFSNMGSIQKYSAIGVGPGIGKSIETRNGLSSLLKNINIPLLIDADGLNIIAEIPALLELLPKGTVITPHPGEFERLFGNSSTSSQRLKLAIEKSKEYDIVIVLKGAYTQVVCPDGEVYFNSTGNPGMATAGSGDVLTGVITSLLGQGYNAISASIIGVYLHGLSGDLAFKNKGSNSLTASDIVGYIGSAFQLIENNSHE
jgi:hydroxyethylthiazole kinase-like uncharacterized protein yjeF